MLRRPRLMCSKSYGGCTAEGVSVSKVALPPTTHSTQIDHAGSFRGKYQEEKTLLRCALHTHRRSTQLWRCFCQKQGLRQSPLAGVPRQQGADLEVPSQ